MRVALLLTSLVCIAVGGLLTLDSGVLKGSVRGGVLGLLIPLVLPFLLLLIVNYLRKGLDPTRLGVMVRDTGITDNTSVIPNIFLPWDNITDIEERVYGNRTCLVLSLDSAETVIQQLPRILHPLGRIVAQGVLTGGNAYVLAPFVLDVPYEALKAVILERFNAYRRANDLPEATADYVPVDLNSLKRKSKQPYALFSERAVAFALDISLFLVPISIACDTLCWLLGLMCGEGVRSRMEVLLPQVAWGSYFTCCHASSWQATIGKRVLGLIVVTDKGTRLSVPRAIARYGALLLSLLSLGIGILMPLWTERRQALHDILVKTLVTRKPTQRTTNTREKT